MKNSKKELSPEADQKVTVEDSELPENGVSHLSLAAILEIEFDGG